MLSNRLLTVTYMASVFLASTFPSSRRVIFDVTGLHSPIIASLQTIPTAAFSVKDCVNTGQWLHLSTSLCLHHL